MYIVQAVQANRPMNALMQLRHWETVYYYETSCMYMIDIQLWFNLLEAKIPFNQKGWKYIHIYRWIKIYVVFKNYGNISLVESAPISICISFDSPFSCTSVLPEYRSLGAARSVRDIGGFLLN